MSPHIIEVKDLHYSYPDDTSALRGISFTITQAQTVGIVGANGAGKSTLLSHFTGILLPTSGTVNIGGLQLSKHTVSDIRKKVGMVFQNPDDQLFMPTVYDDVAFGPLNQNLPPQEVELRVADALKTAGASHLINRPPYKLSGGQKKAVAIAAVLAMHPEILVMDEPSSGLDPLSRRQLINLLKSFNHTKIVATHDLDLVLDLCDRVIVLHDGLILADSSPSDIFADEALLTTAYLEKPLCMQNCYHC